MTFVVLVSCAGQALAATAPEPINFQGVLRATSGDPIDGSTDMVFRFFSTLTDVPATCDCGVANGTPGCDDATCQADVCAINSFCCATDWDAPCANKSVLFESCQACIGSVEALTDTHTGGQAVTVSGGLFNVALGSGTVSDGAGPGVFDSLVEVFGVLGEVYVQLEVGAETLSPRIPVETSAWALSAAGLEVVEGNRSFVINEGRRDSGSKKESSHQAKRYSEQPHNYQHPLDDPQAQDYMRDAFAAIVAGRNLKMSPEDQRWMVGLFKELTIWQNTWFMGIKIQKNPCDLWMMHQIIYEIRPDYIIEAGTFRGGSALYFAHMLDGMGLDDSKVITIDIENVAQEAATLPLWKKHVEFIHGSSTDPEVVARISDEVKGSKVIVVLDSDHSRDHVFQELLAYGSLVSPGSYAVVEDTDMEFLIPPNQRKAGPLAAVLDFLRTEEGKNFSQDFTREAMLFTFNPGGWLKKAEDAGQAAAHEPSGRKAVRAAVLNP